MIYFLWTLSLLCSMTSWSQDEPELNRKKPMHVVLREMKNKAPLHYIEFSTNYACKLYDGRVLNMQESKRILEEIDEFTDPRIDTKTLQAAKLKAKEELNFQNLYE